MKKYSNLNVTESYTKNGKNGKFYVTGILPQF